MTKDFQTSKPIYIQIADHLSSQIVRGEMRAGEKLPSVREMAINSGVNPNTIQRTYSEMERMGIVETKRGQGTFVTENEQVLKELKICLQTDIIDAFVQNMKELGFSQEEMVEGLEQYFRRDQE
ncbi:GntR family transcriptional regulator [Neobacillus massiliamazoniensis]|jgi:GntR family transcriptional regulator|uniref:GntR family transcriptional regulator n=1 Tax=Neobacillus massiliamazoniensis TaxID=1499688 RepID=A0A0U1P373_9BACI|nr:GntR family transcriptional regulator [Neobacillus massiliamazoniensis]CRK84562.1 GntR family transcriptional regulator [Neobacillus massiliamazoniensis]